MGYAVYMPSNSTPIGFDIMNIVCIMHLQTWTHMQVSFTLKFDSKISLK